MMLNSSPLKSPQKRLSAIVDQLLKTQIQAFYVNIVVGELTQFSEEEIRRQWSALVCNSPLEGSVLNVRIIYAEQQCMACFYKYSPQNRETSCPQCGGVGVKIIAGEEFHLESIKGKNE
jgi:hydrogenase nickel incorporation protein HypA/HybF